MYKFSERSLRNLNECDERLIKLMTKSIKTSPYDFSVICGHRNEKDQNKEYADGNSELKFPYGKHNSYPSKAVDVQPYPYTKADIKDKDNIKFKLLTEHIRKTAERLGIEVINGGLEWKWDWFHWQLVGK